VQSRRTGKPKIRKSKCPVPSGRARLRECPLVSLAKMQAGKSKAFTLSIHQSPDSKPLVPNKADITAHLSALFPPAFVHPYPDAWIEIAYARPDGKLERAGNFSAFDLEKAAAFAERKNKAGNNVYVGVALRQGEKPESGRAKGDHVLAASDAWTDYDSAGDDERINAILKANSLTPAIVVTTGTIPHPRRHLYFKLDGTVTPKELGAVNASLRTLFGSDDVQNPDRILRLAGTVNYPSPKKRQERGYVAELTTLHINKDAHSYKVEELIGLAPSSEGDPFSEHGKGSAGLSDADLVQLLKNSRVKNWHNNIRRAVNCMIGRNETDRSIRVTCAAYCEGELKDADLKVLIDSGRKVFDKPDPDHESAAADMATPGEADWKTKLIRSKAGPKPLLANAITALRLHPAWIGVLSYDEFALRVVLDKAPPWYKSMAPWTPRVWVEHDDLSCTNWLQHRDIGVSVGIAAQAVEAVAHARKFHPVRDYLDGLKHDGERRIDTWLVEFLGVEDTPYTRAVGQAMLIAAIARIRDPGCKVDNVPILESDQQGKLKSTSIKAMFDPWFSDELADLGSKDAAMQTCGVWGIEMAELDSMSKSEVSKAKAFITRTTDRFRPPYGRRLIESKRSCVFWGTTNQDEYLRDETGGRRFWPLQVGDLNLEELRAARDQLWAEADVMYAAGTKWWLTDANVLAGAETEQLSRQVSEAWDEPIGKYVAQHVGSSALITPLQVLSEGLFLTEISKIGQPEVNRVVRSLKRLGFKRVRRLNEATGKREYFYQRRIPTGGAEIIPLAGRRPALDSATRRMIEGADEIAAAKARGSNF
jgi:hypothetical protein